jgi:hypothetical protein
MFAELQSISVGAQNLNVFFKRKKKKKKALQIEERMKGNGEKNDQLEVNNEL